ncbi:BBE domain-containing protein [Alloacidobacterium dinghuense]|uniref:BBE domain-containing protein n=1 Tax=Alloacidobacterium dinghuense TaxID=2763107 RepID=A0A7G8BRD0_9BACT|nr:BBE domain-containing protein [Alloacidobacterium dinghuense]
MRYLRSPRQGRDTIRATRRLHGCHARLRAVKAAYDSDSRFRRNNNIQRQVGQEQPTPVA